MHRLRCGDGVGTVWGRCVEQGCVGEGKFCGEGGVQGGTEAALAVKGEVMEASPAVGWGRVGKCGEGACEWGGGRGARQP